MILAHTLSLMMPDCHQCNLSIVPLILLGISYTVYAIVLFGALPYFVKEDQIALAYGICQAFSNLGTVIAPIIISFITGTSNDPHEINNYNWVQYFFIFVSTVALCLNSTVLFLGEKFKKNMNEENNDEENVCLLK